MNYSLSWDGMRASPAFAPRWRGLRMRRPHRRRILFTRPSRLTRPTRRYLSPMSKPEPVELPEGDGPPAAYAAAEEPVALRVRLIDDERTPEGMVCMATYHDTRLIARYVMPPEMWSQVAEHDLFGNPVPVVLVAREAAPGLQCQLYALLQLPPGLTDDEPEDEAEPWAASVPGASYDATVEDDDEEMSDNLVAFPLGHIVRFDKDRVHPGNLPLEAADILRRLIEGKTTEVVDKALEDLLGD